MDKISTSIFASSLPPFVVPSSANSMTAWAGRIWQDLQPTPGRLSGTLRIVPSTVLTLLALQILQTPFAALALYFVFIVGRDSPGVPLRSIFSVVSVVAAVATELGIVILTDNDPMARVIGNAAVGFFAGILVLGTTLPTLGSTWGIIFARLIALWETHAPANQLVTTSLWIIGALSIPILCSIAVEYVFGARHPRIYCTNRAQSAGRHSFRCLRFLPRRQTPKSARKPHHGLPVLLQLVRTECWNSTTKLWNETLTLVHC